MFPGNKFEANKENMTPTSLISSTSKFYSNQKYYAENTMKLMREKVDDISTQMEMNEVKYFKLLKNKEELSMLLFEKDNEAFKEKAEIEYLNDIIREKESNKKSLSDNLENHANIYLDLNVLANNFLFQENIPNENTAKIKLKNGFNVIGDKNRDGIIISKIVSDSPANGNINSIFEKEFSQDPELLKLFAAYNIA